MSAPAVGGIIALWLQADPHLTPDDVMGVIARTGKPCGDYGERPDNYCGYGMIDAYAGLLDILGMSGIEGLTTHRPQGMGFEYRHDGSLTVTLDKPACHGISLRIYDTCGRLRQKAMLQPGATRFETSLASLPSGIYAILADGCEASEKGSVLIRKE